MKKNYNGYPIEGPLGRRRVSSSRSNGQAESYRRRLGSRSFSARSKAVEELPKLPGGASIELLIDALKDPHFQVRYIAAERLGDIRSKKALPYLIDALGDSDETVRMNAAESLGYYRSKKSIPALVASLDDPDELVRAYTAWSLGKIQSKETSEVLRRKLKSEKSPTVLLRILGALYLRGDRFRIKQIVKLLNSRDYRVRCATAKALSEISEPKRLEAVAVALLSRLVKEKTVAARSSIKESLHHIINRL